MRASQFHPDNESPPSLLVTMGLAEPLSGRHPVGLKRALTSISMMWPLVIAVRFGLMVMLAGARSIDWLKHDVAAGGTLVATMLAMDLAIFLLPRLSVLQKRPPHIRLRWLVAPIFLSGILYGVLARGVFGTGTMLGEAGLLFAVMVPALVAFSIFGAQRLLGVVYCGAVLFALVIELPIGLSISVPIMGICALLLAAIAQARAEQSALLEGQLALLRGEQAQALLTDFEEAGQGWFWETDRAGRLTYVSETLARKVGTSVEELLGAQMTSLIDPRADSQPGDGQRTVGFHMSARSAFSDIAVRAAREEESWWSLSGRPIVNEFGQFLGFRGAGADLTEMRKSQAEVVRLARFDSLTGLANRSQMTTTLEQAMADSSGRQGDCALFLLDLDRFKVVNDTMGHPAGDALLRQVAQRLSRAVGNAGKVGRLGGDEFQVVLPGLVDRPELAKLAERIIHSISQPYAIEETQVVIGVSVGIAIAPEDGPDADTLIRNGDLALYDAKDAGRGVCRFYSQDMHTDAEERRRMEQDLRHAISTGGLHVEYQAVVSATTERISGFETLVRWNHPTRGAISPADFIPVAEEAGLVAQIGEWVLRTACLDAAGWPEGTRVAVNVSPIQFRSAQFPAIVMSALAKSGISPDRLELEITESVFLDEGSDTDTMFAQLKKLGVRLALDDFGTGYSALRYLRSAPIDKIKIDQSFVRGAAIKGSRNGAIVKAIVTLAEALSMETTAEGAETLDELDLIRSLGCSHVQGYVYGRPSRNETVMANFAQNGVYAQASGHKASRENRRTMLRSIRLLHGDRSYEGRIRNISPGGVMVEGLADVPTGTIFQVAFSNNYLIDATCRWCSDGRVGLEFATPIQLDRARSELGATDGAGQGIRRKVA